MQALSVQAKTFPFKVEPIFKIYEEIHQFYTFVTPERLSNHYETTVKRKVKELEVEYRLVEGTSSPLQHLRIPDLDELSMVQEHIGMWPTLNKSDLIDVMEVYHIMYLSDEGEMRNISVLEVW